MDSEIMAEAIEAMAANGVTKMNAFILKHGGSRDVTMPAEDDGSARHEGDAARMLGRERDLLRAVAKLARDSNRR